MAWAAERHPQHGVALAVRIGNEPAIRLYSRHGFADAGPSPDHPRTERLMLRRAGHRHPGRVRRGG